jgi:glycosyltransferase involved in cell wall biosynthesis
MTDLATAPPARIYTTWGTVLFVDSASGQLRHGPIDTSPANAVFVADRTAAGSNRPGWFMFDSGARLEPIACGALSCRAVSRANGGDPPPTPTLLDLVPLERGLIAFSAGGLFLCAQPDGRIDLVNPVCSIWECFLASEDWCSATSDAGDGRPGTPRNGAINWKGIARFIVDARLRIQVNTTSKATKVLIFGYTSWSHGRVYYDLCKRLQKKGYIVDVINWQEKHNDYIAELISFYDFIISALDGISILADIYGVPYEQIIAVSHHEMDIRILSEQKGIEIFDRFAGYGVVSYQLFDASAIFGIRRHPLVVQLGVNFDEFCVEIPERLATVGYAGSFSHKTIDGIEIKRGELAEAAAREAGLAFKVAGSTADQISFHDMPEFYKSVDAILITSVSEGAQLPVKEGAAAGRLVISTPVGDFPLRASQGVGIVAPIESHKYKNFVTASLKHFKENPAAFAEICRKTQDAARKLDWQYVIDDWVELIETAKRYALDQARSHQQAGRFAEAAGLFAIRAGRGGDDEEKWYARWQHARCLRELGDEEGFVQTALQAFRERPQRAEPLHDLANYYLQTQRAGPAAVYAEAALAIPLPEQDLLSVDLGLYETGLRHTFAAIASWSQDPEQKERGRKVCDWLALSRDVPEHIRNPARYNSGWYAAPAETLFPSLQFHPLSVEAPDGFRPANLSICSYGDGFIAIVRTVNWMLKDGFWYVLQGRPPYRSHLLFLQLNHLLGLIGNTDVWPPEDMPVPENCESGLHHDLGFADSRPFIWRDEIWCISIVRQLNEQSLSEMVLSRIDMSQPSRYVMTDWRVVPSGMPARHEKNWMPQVIGDELRLIYSVDPTRILTDSGAVLHNEPTQTVADSFRGGSQVVAFDDGWLALIHEVEQVNGKRWYFHRFVWLDAANTLCRQSRRFYFRQHGIEFAAGMTWHPDDKHLVISFSVDDSDLYLAVVDADDVRAILLEIAEHRRASEEVVEAASATLAELQGSNQGAE